MIEKSATQYYRQQLRPAFLWYGEGFSRVTRNAIDDLHTAFTQYLPQGREIRCVGFDCHERLRYEGPPTEHGRVDVGVKELVVLSTGERFAVNQKLKANIHYLRRHDHHGKSILSVC